MSRVCLFCRNRAGTKEDAWPLWLISSVGADPVAPTEFWHTVNEPPDCWVGPKFQTKKRCRECDNGWMSDLEVAIKPTMGELISDVALTLDEDQRRLLALWAVKTAMVIQGAKHADTGF